MIPILARPSIGVIDIPMQRIDLVYLGDGLPPTWPHGQVFAVDPSPTALAHVFQGQLATSQSEAWLFWGLDASPPDTLLPHLLAQPVDVWHGGLNLGMGGSPRMIDFLWPLWMLNCDPPSDIEATSWRMSLRASLIRIETLRQLGGPLPQFDTLDGTALDLGFRYIKAGAIMRHCPDLVADSGNSPPVNLTLADELRFLNRHAVLIWRLYALTRAKLRGMATSLQLLRTIATVRRETYPRYPDHFVRPESTNATIAPDPRVSVLIPTVERYPYLRLLLSQLCVQTIRPYEIIIVDQTPSDVRDRHLAADFSDLPLRIIEMDEPGQCRSRNLGLQDAQGDYILFIDDDDEIPCDFIEAHLRNLIAYEVDVSSGTVYEPGNTGKAVQVDRKRMSDVFPTNNTLLRRAALKHSGLFDLAYDRLARADGDLGMRVYLSGNRMLLDESRPILHHHAPRGGLRMHKARVVTRAGRRNSLTQRNLMTASDFYLGYRYFRVDQVREMRLISLWATLTMSGSLWRRSLRFLISLCYFPDSLARLRKAEAQARKMLNTYPQIPKMKS